MRSNTTRHGTLGGYAKHQTNGEEPCETCRRAKSEYDARYRASPKVAIRSRLSARAQARASTRMRKLYPEVWAVLYQEELTKLKAENPGIW